MKSDRWAEANLAQILFHFVARIVVCCLCLYTHEDRSLCWLMTAQTTMTMTMTMTMSNRKSKKRRESEMNHSVKWRPALLVALDFLHDHGGLLEHGEVHHGLGLVPALVLLLRLLQLQYLLCKHTCVCCSVSMCVSCVVSCAVLCVACVMAKRLWEIGGGVGGTEGG